MLSEGTRSLLAAKHVIVATIDVHPTSIARAKVHALKHNVAIIVLTDVEFKLRSGELAIQGKV